MATQVSPVHNRPAHVLTPAEQRAAYDQDGYLVFRELLDATELAVLRSALGEVVRDAESLTETNDKFSITRPTAGLLRASHLRPHRASDSSRPPPYLHAFI